MDDRLSTPHTTKLLAAVATDRYFEQGLEIISIYEHRRKNEFWPAVADFLEEN